MPTFVLNRDLTLASRLGATVRFEKNKPTFAPAFLRAEIENLGGEMTSENAPDEEKVKPTVTRNPDDAEPQGDARVTAMNAVFEKHALAHGAEKSPSVKDMHVALGWTPTAAERDAAWDTFKAGK